ncbi:transcriptional repressor p66-alpha isoform X3 [Microplitis mediator]|uniref:transcriptional repressor p66-alpha isoform X3 n=1 Tax=Microplitis mediator TaxID=375433 RepID=UPI002557A9E1|nr:transcriptional repressor p66-alpha isoform X3 [Microplitis mediator]XP_057330930.1 transcriptional repressor p66-alpha isoform X3 [Microplitis mediator]XP_057330931.1 transcriptional repressor p66-alpha isoform X3 [Microplitis mediator]XP_057330932.1 transcriptional repressor p66-alpha isoform X3 [Microplitis mediator]
MEAMDLDGDSVVDLSVSVRRESSSASSNLSGDPGVPLNLGINYSSNANNNSDNNILEPRNIQNSSRGILAPKTGEDRRPRRILRPRTEKSYAESPDEPRINGYVNGNNSDSDEGEMPPLLPIKELSSDELAEREKNLRKLKEDLRSEEMKLVLLKKIKQSQQLKENIAAIPPKVANKIPPPVTVQPVAHSHRITKAPPPLLRGQPAPSRSSSLHAPPPGMLLPPNAGRSPTSSTGMPPNMVIPQPPHPRTRPPSVSANVPTYHALPDRTERSTKDPTPVPAHQQLVVGSQESKTTTAINTPVIPEQERPREDSQRPAQRQAAAKLALRNQLEKTLLQIPPPKPPPPEMHFVPNPSNTEFIYLVGLEHVVDFITKEPAIPPPPEPFECTQCKTDFTPVWKWEKPATNGKKEGPRGQHATFLRPPAGRDPRVICEHCVTTNVKKALKAEHTNRLKTAFVKALQQEHEMEQKLAQAASPSPDPPAPKPVPKAVTPTRRVATPPAPQPSVQQVPPPAPTPPTQKLQDHPLVKLAESGKFSPHHAAAAAALQQQLIRVLNYSAELTKSQVPGLPQHQPLPAHMMPQFNPLLYPYQLAMAQAAGSKGMVELQRQAADLQRQYLLDMIPSQASQGQGNQAPSRAHPHNWKT